MTTTLSFSFQHRPLVPFAHDYAHGDQEDWHQHDCAQLLHILSGVVRVATPVGYWVVPPGRGVWLPAGTPHALRMTGNVAARTLFIDPLARADLPAGCQIVQITPLLRELIVSSLALAERYAPASRDERIYELILDEIRGMAILPFGLAGAAKRNAASAVPAGTRGAGRGLEQRPGGEGVQHERANPKPPFSAAD